MEANIKNTYVDNHGSKLFSRIIPNIPVVRDANNIIPKVPSEENLFINL